ncbi:hypothetical protein [Ulvibacterium marinum]|uniref:Lipocalin-like domain-containing protein n=1 Tax=Ulvibacterium marinum TaxID=2419782 RepID=A0A3B0BVF0_9FLAO|nr:hypothetical protein [Ulvibacterium marinum]RKN77022.1 hypothetical protein D7Z94_24925 [Ulvibacterium marinum]
MKINQILHSYLACLAVFLIIISCSKSDDTVEPVIEEQVDVIDPALVGTWEGTVSGSFGDADMTMVLESNGDMSAEGSTSLYCPMDAKWKVKSNRFKASGNDRCDGTSVTFDAPYSKTKLSGSWSAGSGNSGTFNAEKQ